MEHKARVLFSADVWEKIEWFTNNLSTEIGALGRVSIKKEDGEKYYYVDKLYFPKQKVSGATVHFTPDMWGDLIKEHGLKEMTKTNFYWHRHPGNAAHSGVDDEDTFEAFMSKEANRSHFLFMQTAINSKGEWDEELRIDIRKPIRATITNDCIVSEVEISKEEDKVKKECEKIRDEVIIKEIIKPVISYWEHKQSFKTKEVKQNCLVEIDGIREEIDIGNYKSIEEAVDGGRFGKIVLPNDFDNDFIGGVPSCREEKLAITFENGQVTVFAGKIFKNMLEKRLKTKFLKPYVRQIKKKNTSGDIIKYNLQPISGGYKKLRTIFLKMYFVFCNMLLKDYKYIIDDIEEEDGHPPQNLEKVVNSDLAESYILEETPEVIEIIIDQLQSFNTFDWVNVNTALLTCSESKDSLGELTKTDDGGKLFITGPLLITLIKEIEKTLEIERAKED